MPKEVRLSRGLSTQSSAKGKIPPSADALLAELSRSIGLELSFNERRACSFYIDSRYTMHFFGEEGSICVKTILGKYPEPEPENFAGALLVINRFLEANGPHGPHLGVFGTNESRVLLLSMNLLLCGLDAKAFQKKIEDMVDILEHVIKILAERKIILRDPVKKL